MNKQTEALKMVTDILDDELWFPNKYPDEAIPVCFIEALKACKEALEQDDRVYTNTNHGFTLKDRHFYVEGNWDENFDYDASIAIYGDFEDDEQKKQYAQMVCDALNAQREALEQPAQEPVAWMSEGGIFTRTKEHAEIWSNNGGKVTPVYTHPAPSFIGLNDDEMMEIWCSDEVESTLDFGRAIEQALKEKNHG